VVLRIVISVVVVVILGFYRVGLLDNLVQSEVQVILESMVVLDTESIIYTTIIIYKYNYIKL